MAVTNFLKPKREGLASVNKGQNKSVIIVKCYLKCKSVHYKLQTERKYRHFILCLFHVVVLMHANSC